MRPVATADRTAGGGACPNPGCTAISTRNYTTCEDANEPFWTSFLRSLVKRGLAGTRLVISDAHEGFKAAITRTMAGATWQRCRVHFMRNALAHVPRSQNTVVAAAIRQVFVQPDQAGATTAWRHVADQLRER
jgi:transposase-like protein